MIGGLGSCSRLDITDALLGEVHIWLKHSLHTEERSEALTWTTVRFNSNKYGQ